VHGSHAICRNQLLELGAIDRAMGSQMSKYGALDRLIGHGVGVLAFSSQEYSQDDKAAQQKSTKKNKHDLHISIVPLSGNAVVETRANDIFHQAPPDEYQFGSRNTISGPRTNIFHFFDHMNTLQNRPPINAFEI